MKTVFFFLAGLLFSVHGHANDLLNDGFSVANRNPLHGLFGIPRHEPDRALENGQWESGFGLEAHNIFFESEVAGESLFLDGEVQLATLSFRRGFSSQWSLGLKIPVISHSGGFLDGFIDNWHDWFDLDDFDRGSAPEDQLRYHYQGNRGSEILLSDDSSGIGDVSLFVMKSFGDDDSSGSARLEIKFPTGDVDELTGNDGFMVGGRLQHSGRIGERSRYFGGIGLVWLEEGGLLPEMQREFAATLTAGLSIGLGENLAFNVQVDAQSGLFENSAIEQLTESAVQLSLGLVVAAGTRGAVDFVVIEDEWRAGSSPDLGILIRYRRR